jgi:hypothetical protein
MRCQNECHAGLCQLSQLTRLQTLIMRDSFISCTYVGLVAALATMTGATPNALHDVDVV